MTETKGDIFLGVARLVARHEEHDSIAWLEDLTVLAFCSDVFAWGTADCERIETLADVEAFAAALEDCHRAAAASHLGAALYAARRRGMRPQGPPTQRTRRWRHCSTPVWSAA